MAMFTKATKEKAKLRMAIIGPAGSGKTYTALKVATAMGGKIAVIDTEHGSASKYSDLFGFEKLELESFSPANYVMAIQAAQKEGFEIVIIDSLSHAWSGKDGALEQVDKAKSRSQSGNSFTAWRDVTPMHNKLIDTIIGAGMHVISTMRAKTEYVMEKDEATGKIKPRKIGIAPVQRDGMEYEFDVVATMNMDNLFMVDKTRCPALNGAVIAQPGADLAEILKKWLNDGVEPAPKKVLETAPAPAAQQTAAGAVGDDKGGASEAAQQAAPEQKNPDEFTIKGVLESAKESPTMKGKFGIKIMGKKQVFVTLSEPAYQRALGMKGKKVSLAYRVTMVGDKQQFDMLFIEEVKSAEEAK